MMSGVEPLQRRKESVRTALNDAGLVLGRCSPTNDPVEVFAPVNIAVLKYWGKRDKALNLPVTDSVSITLPELGTRTSMHALDGEASADEVWLNDQPLAVGSPEYARVTAHIDLLRQPGDYFCIRSSNSIPTAAGLASSASGFAALTQAMLAVYGVELLAADVSMIARLGSGSACRSVYNGFVHWVAGERTDGRDSVAHPISGEWAGLCIGLLMVETQTKVMPSTQGMLHTQETSRQYAVWPDQVNADQVEILAAIAEHDFTRFGEAVERNALCMHASMMCAWPPLVYWQPSSVEMMQHVWSLRKQGVEVYFTMDAGPNLKLVFLEKDRAVIERAFPALTVVVPFGEKIEG